MTPPAPRILALARSSTPDSDFIARVLSGDLDSFEVLMRRHNGRLYKVARGILGNDDETEDVLQEAYFRAYTHLEGFSGEAKFSTWLTRIAVHEALRRVRRAKKLAVITQSRADQRHGGTGTEAPPETLLRSELSAKIANAIDGLPAGHRTVFVLRRLEKLSTRETAAQLGLSETAVRARLSRACRDLREALAPYLRSVAGEIYPFHLLRCGRVVARVFARISANSTPRGGRSSSAPRESACQESP